VAPFPALLSAGIAAGEPAGPLPAMAVACPGHWPAWPGMWASAPSVSGPGSKDPWCKKFCACFQFQKNCRNYLKLAKIIGNYLFVKKMQMTYQNVQKIVIYLLMLSSCIVKQFGTLFN
jgi:hypothetical protein